MNEHASEIARIVDIEDELVDAVALALNQGGERMLNGNLILWDRIRELETNDDGDEEKDRQAALLAWRYQARLALEAIVERYRICNAHPAGDGVTWHLVDEWRPS